MTKKTFFLALVFFGLSASVNAQAPIPLSDSYIGCPGYTVTAGFVQEPNVTYDWFSAQTDGNLIGTGYTYNFLITASLFPGEGRTFWAQPKINGVPT